MCGSYACRSCEDVVESIHTALMKVSLCTFMDHHQQKSKLCYETETNEFDMFVHMQVQEEMRNGQIALEKYVITKSLTKPPEAYPDAKNQPHVEVSPKNQYMMNSSYSFLNIYYFIVVSFYMYNTTLIIWLSLL